MNHLKSLESCVAGTEGLDRLSISCTFSQARGFVYMSSQLNPSVHWPWEKQQLFTTNLIFHSGFPRIFLSQLLLCHLQFLWFRPLTVLHSHFSVFSFSTHAFTLLSLYGNQILQSMIFSWNSGNYQIRTLAFYSSVYKTGVTTQHERREIHVSLTGLTEKLAALSCSGWGGQFIMC